MNPKPPRASELFNRSDMPLVLEQALLFEQLVNLHWEQYGLPAASKDIFARFKFKFKGTMMIAFQRYLHTRGYYYPVKLMRSGNEYLFPNIAKYRITPEMIESFMTEQDRMNLERRRRLVSKTTNSSSGLGDENT